MGLTLIKNAQIVNEGQIVEGDVLIDGEFIVDIDISISSKSSDTTVIDAEGKFLIPGVMEELLPLLKCQILRLKQLLRNC